AEEAERFAASLDRKRRILIEFLEKVLGADPEEAEQEACYLEHFLSDGLLERMERVVDFATECDDEFSELMDRVWSHRVGEGCAQRRLNG
ncbi:MAG: hypothetical protein C0167_03330, partial [Nitrososphaera sp.]